MNGKPLFLCEPGERYDGCPDIAAEVEAAAWGALGAFLANMLGGNDPSPGPPYTHTIAPPEPIGEDEDGNPIYPPPGPACTLTDRS